MGFFFCLGVGGGISGLGSFGGFVGSHRDLCGSIIAIILTPGFTHPLSMLYPFYTRKSCMRKITSLLKTSDTPRQFVLKRPLINFL